MKIFIKILIIPFILFFVFTSETVFSNGNNIIKNKNIKINKISNFSYKLDVKEINKIKKFLIKSEKGSFLTKDGGLSWSKLNPLPLLKVFIITKYDGIKIKTEDAGITWNKVNSEINPVIPFNFFPNPAVNQFNIVSNDETLKFSKISIVNCLGIILNENNNINISNYLINVDGLCSGMYFLKVQMTNGYSYTTNFIKQ